MHLDEILRRFISMIFFFFENLFWNYLFKIGYLRGNECRSINFTKKHFNLLATRKN